MLTLFNKTNFWGEALQKMADTVIAPHKVEYFCVKMLYYLWFLPQDQKSQWRNIMIFLLYRKKKSHLERRIEHTFMFYTTVLKFMVCRNVDFAVSAVSD